MSSDQDQGAAGVTLVSGGPQPGDESVFLIDCAPDDGGRPTKCLAVRSYAEEVVATDPVRFRISAENETEPLERSDGQPAIAPSADR
jgi:hypothetical protein